MALCEVSILAFKNTTEVLSPHFPTEKMKKEYKSRQDRKRNFGQGKEADIVVINMTKFKRN